MKVKSNSCIGISLQMKSFLNCYFKKMLEFVILKIKFNPIYLFLFQLFFFGCYSNFGIEDGTLITQSEAEKRIGLSISTKILENYPSYGFPVPFNLSNDPNCNRVSFFKKKAIRNCTIIILSSRINSTDYADYMGKLKALVDTVCNLEKQIYLDNAQSGEVNLCGISGKN